MLPLERSLASGLLPWSVIEMRTKDFWVFKHPTVDNVFIFAPVTNLASELYATYKGCYLFGYNGYESGKWKHFTIKQECGSETEIPYPHIELITY